ncbi:MAG TPA: NUDIX domain-containing protein [Pyrinomonadaceae bacterium]|jgi:8-oxo-dGTP pyrophosphatase MutT (NUDIX family)
MKRTESAGGIVINREGLVLVVNQNGTSWSLPKGHIEDGEDKLSAARREIYEESGVTELSLVKELGSYQRHRIGVNGREDQSELKVIHMFLFTSSQDELSPVDPQNPEARWVEKEKVVEFLTHQQDKDFFLAHYPNQNQRSIPQ